MSPALRVARRAGAGARCPLCLDGLDEAPLACPRCATPHHRACADELVRCGVLGCGVSLLPFDGRLAAAAADPFRAGARARAARSRRDPLEAVLCLRVGGRAVALCAAMVALAAVGGLRG